VKHLDTCHLCRRTDVAGCVAPQLYGRLAEYDYPGNVRELRNLLSRLAALVSDQEIRPEDAAPYLTSRPASLSGPRTDLRLESVVREHILEVLRLSGNNKTKAARALGLPLTTLVEEQHFTTFFRLGNSEIIAGLREQFPELPREPAPREVFVALRALRNKW
jgi:DNA-binding NtrC family response regulator